jgi:hypothetical protein
MVMPLSTRESVRSSIPAMSIALTIKAPGADPQHVPIATESFFNLYWLPVSERLGLGRVLELQFGVTIPAAELADVIAEMSQLQAAMAGNAVPEVPRDAANAIVDRLEHVLGILRGLDTSQGLEVSIG